MENGESSDRKKLMKKGDKSKKRKMEKGDCSKRKKEKKTTKSVQNNEENISWNLGQKVLYYSKLKVLDNIVKTLTPDQLEMFKLGPFGHFLGFGVKKCQAQLLVHLIRRISDTSTDDTLIFHIEGHIAKFGLREFCLLTGLNCNPFPKTMEIKQKESKTQLRNAFFKNRESIDRKDVMAAFIIGSTDDQLMVKIANLYIFECFLYSKQYHNKVDWKHLELIDNDDALLTYPWGRLIFNLTIEYFRKAANDKTSNFALQGFPHILLCWAYEIIPKISEPPNGISIQICQECPRMLSWQSHKQPDWNYLQESIFSASNFSVVPFTPNEDDLTASYFQQFVNDPVQEIEKIINEENELIVEEQNVTKDESANIISLNNEVKEIRRVLLCLKDEVREMKTTTNEIMRMLTSMMEVINERLPQKIDLDKQSQESMHQNKAPTRSLQQLEDEMNIQNVVDIATNYANETEIEEDREKEDQQTVEQNVMEIATKEKEVEEYQQEDQHEEDQEKEEKMEEERRDEEEEIVSGGKRNE